MDEENNAVETEQVEVDSFDEGNESGIDTFEDPTLEGDFEKEDDKVSQTEQVGETDGKEKEEEEDEEDDSEDKDEDSEEEEETEEDDEVSEDADGVFKVKVDGEEVEVTLQDLKNSFSGHKAVEKRFAEFSREKRKFNREMEKANQELNAVKEDLANHLNTITTILDDPRKNPLEALYYLVDLKGGNVVEYEKKLMSNLGELFEQFSEMDEVEKELFWTKKEKDFLQRRKETNYSRSEQEQANRNSQAQLEELWETHGVTEDDFYDARDELVEMGYDVNEIKPENVVKFIELKPLYDQANSIASDYADELGDDYDEFVDHVAKAVTDFPNLSDEDILIMTAKNMGFEVEVEDQDVNELKSKLPPRSVKKTKTKRNEFEIDSF